MGTQNRLIERVYHPYWLWEETFTNMWKQVDNREEWLKRAIEFTGDAPLYGKWMMDVVDEWPYSCEHNLTNLEQNRRAWIGHAACALAFNCPEDIVREAWGYLSEMQQRLANKQADKAIQHWEARHVEKRAGDFGFGRGERAYQMDL